jgi:hypothetical protein
VLGEGAESKDAGKRVQEVRKASENLISTFLFGNRAFACSCGHEARAARAHLSRV